MYGVMVFIDPKHTEIPITGPGAMQQIKYKSASFCVAILMFYAIDQYDNKVWTFTKHVYYELILLLRKYLCVKTFVCQTLR